MFTGTYTYAIDRKGRVVLPAAFRAQLGRNLVVTRAPDRCLYLCTPAQGYAVLNRQSAGNVFREFFLSGAVVIEPMPGTFRLRIPAELRAWVQLAPPHRATFAGIGGTVVLCRADRWERRMLVRQGRILETLAQPRPAFV